MPNYATLGQKKALFSEIYRVEPHLKGKPIIRELFREIKRKCISLDKIFTYQVNGRRFQEFYVQKFSLLLYASLSGNVELLKIAVSCGTALNAHFGRSKATLLHWVANRGHLSAAEFLLSHDKNLLYETNFCNDTPLHWAAMMGRENIVRLFIKHKAELNVRNISKKSPMDLALANGHGDAADIIRFELEKEFLAKKISDFITYTKLPKFRHLAKSIGSNFSIYDKELLSLNHEQTIKIIEDSQDLTVNIVMQILQNQYLVSYLYGALKIDKRDNVASEIRDEFNDKSETKEVKDEKNLDLKILYKQIRHVLSHAPYDRILRKFEKKYEYEPINKDMTWDNSKLKIFQEIFSSDINLENLESLQKVKKTIAKFCYEENGEIIRVNKKNMTQMLTIALYRPDLMLRDMQENGQIEANKPDERHEKFIEMKEKFFSLMIKQLSLSGAKEREASRVF